MDYYVFVTRSCNLRCSYCCFGESLLLRDGSSPRLDPAETARSILGHAAKHPGEDHKVYFYGGEPSLDIAWIEEFVAASEGRLRYILQTNGTRLDRFPPDLLTKIHFLEISIDGTPEVHDAHRGRGTWEKVVSNLERIRSWYPGGLLARMTYTPENPLARSVRLLVEDLGFDQVYWMHEDGETPVESWREDRASYSEALDELIRWWWTGADEGHLAGVIPFRSILASLLWPPERPAFRCGVGTTLRVIDVDGTCYPCDLMITDDRRHALGHLGEGIPDEIHLPENPIYESRCARCPELPACGGRCFTLGYNRDERFDEFCWRTRLLIGKLRALVPEARRLLAEGRLRESDIRLESTLTEEIP